ncbi:MAG: phage major capsid protein [Epibacterium sp.]|nr:phage major capsid protein [Epibacterium sp.]NQX73741.1 phage major capsid protein [Epibacterium sp.]
MPFTAQEIQHISNAVLEYFIREQPKLQTAEVRPFLNDLLERADTFPGGRANIILPVYGAIATSLIGYDHDDSVPYVNPANSRQATYPWREHHIGFNITFSQLKKAGIRIANSATGEGVSKASDMEKAELFDMLVYNINDMMEGWERGMSGFLWGDGTADPKAIVGVRSFILDNPLAVGAVAGIDPAVDDWWQNRAITATAAAGPYSTPGPILANVAATNSVLIETLTREQRQLRRFKSVGRRQTPENRPAGTGVVLYCGSGAYNRIEDELRAKGSYSEMGFTNRDNDVGVSSMTLNRDEIVYEPELDNIGRPNFVYAIDLDAVRLRPMEGEERVDHSPARPEDIYALYRAQTSTAALTCEQRNCNAVYEVTL